MAYSCLDLNAYTDAALWPLPDCENIIAAVGDARVFSSLDIKAGFHNVPVREDKIGWMAFSMQDGLFEWLRMPFGPKGAPAHFQRMVHVSIERVQDGRILVYIDDILVAG